MDLKKNKYPKQKQFIECGSHTKLWVGGNRSGKTISAIIDMVLELVGEHPLQKQGLRPNPPLDWRACTESFKVISDVLAPEILHWLPKDSVRRYDSRNQIIYLKNGGKCDLLSYEQEVGKFASAKKHGVVLDEAHECSEPQFNECQMRLMDYSGRTVMNTTPVYGIDWIYDRVYLPSLQPDSGYFSIVSSIWDNPYLNEEKKREAIEKLSGEEREIREFGKWIHLAGLVWPEFNNDYVKNGGHIIDPFPLPKEKTVYMAIDTMSRKQAVLWLFILPSGRLVFFDELYTEDVLIEDVARMILEKEKGMGEIYSRYIDWNASTPDPVTGNCVLAEYARFNICCSPAVKDWQVGKFIGKEYWNAKDKEGFPLCVVFSTLKNFRQQLTHYIHVDPRHRKDIEPANKPKKSKDIHLPDVARYLFAIRPEYIRREESMQRIEIDHLDPLSEQIRRGEIRI